MSLRDQYALQNLDKTSSVTEQLLESPRSYPRRKAGTCRDGFLHRVGWFGICTLTLGTVFVLGILGFLGFLWGSPEDHLAWRMIILADWATRAVTVAALVIRTVVTIQAALCTSMLAALALQRFDVLARYAAEVSLMRFENTGPAIFSLMSMRSMGHGNAFMTGAIAILLSLSTGVLQFTSTILLSDIKLATVTDFERQTDVAYGYNYSTFHDDGDFLASAFWSNRPLPYPTFAEYAELPETVDSVHDTGTTMRAFFPVSPASQRESLKSYNGMATVVDTRVVCARPVLKDLQVFIPRNADNCAPWVSGRIGVDQPIPRFKSDSSGDRLDKFNCTSAILGDADGTELPLSICKLSSEGGIVSIMNDEAEDIASYMTEGPGMAYLVSHATGSYDTWQRYSKSRNNTIIRNNGTVPGSKLAFKDPEDFTSDGEWLIIPSNDPEISLSLSICYSAFHVDDFPIEASIETSHIEPDVGWDSSSKAFDTLAVRKQLGVTSPPVSLESRGIFNLSPPSSWSSPLVKAGPTMQSFITTCANIEWATNPFYVIMMCQFCTPGENQTSYEWIHQSHTALFGDIVRETLHPALALQAFFTVILGMAYFQHAVPFDYKAPTTVVSFVQAQRPTTWTGFIVVCSVLTLHFFVLGLTTILFALYGKDSVLGDARKAVQQVREYESYDRQSPNGVGYTNSRPRGRTDSERVGLGVINDGVEAVIRKAK